MISTYAVKEGLNRIRAPKQCSPQNVLIFAAVIFAAGIGLGVFSKWLDNLALDSSIWWHRLLETLDLGNFFSDFAVWLLIALIIAVFSTSALRAALNVFVFFPECVFLIIYIRYYSAVLILHPI